MHFAVQIDKKHDKIVLAIILARYRIGIITFFARNFATKYIRSHARAELRKCQSTDFKSIVTFNDRVRDTNWD